MKKIYPYRMRHQVGLTPYCIFKLQEKLAASRDHLVTPIETALTFGFIVGCGHSGTTLLAAKIGNHSSVHAIPKETNIFSPRRSLYAAGKEINQWIAAAQSGSKTCIIEKTPKHVHCIDRIRNVIPWAKAIMIARNPLDTCASLYKRFNDLDLAVGRWNLDNAALLEAYNPEFCLLLHYEKLTLQPEATLKNACNFLGLAWDETILKAGKTVYDNSKQTGNMELRRVQVQEEVKPNVNTWHKVFSRREADLIVTKTSYIGEKLGYMPAPAESYSTVGPSLLDTGRESLAI